MHRQVVLKGTAAAATPMRNLRAQVQYNELAVHRQVVLKGAAAAASNKRSKVSKNNDDNEGHGCISNKLTVYLQISLTAVSAAGEGSRAATSTTAQQKQ